MRTISVCVVLIASPALPADEPELEQYAFFEGKLSILIPKGFKPMDEETLKLKYPSAARPNLVYTNERGSVNVAINHTKSVLSPKQLAAFHKAAEAQYKKQYPTAKWFRSEIIEIHGKECVVLELRTPAIDTDIRNLILATSVDDRLMLISFNVTKELEDEWLKAGNKIIDSVKIK